MAPWNLGDWSLSSIFGGDNGTTQTVNAIRSAVHFAMRRPEIRKRAELIIFNCPERDEYCEVTRIMKWVEAHFRYVRDPIGLELVKSPEITDAEIEATGKFQGDCDDITAYISALLKTVGYPVRAAVIAIPGKGEEYRHIYPKVYLPKRRVWLTLEMTAKQRPIGWQAENSRIREYDL